MLHINDTVCLRFFPWLPLCNDLYCIKTAVSIQSLGSHYWLLKENKFKLTPRTQWQQKWCLSTWSDLSDLLRENPKSEDPYS